MSVLIKGLNIKPCKDGFDGKGLVIIGYDDKLYAVAHEQIIPLPDHGDLIDRNMLIGGFADWYITDILRRQQTGVVVAETIGDAIKTIEAAPAVIPAERSEDGERRNDGIKALNNLPTIDPVKHGKWIPVDEKNDAFDCSECDAMVQRRYNYCPHCGARMERSEISE